MNIKVNILLALASLVALQAMTGCAINVDVRNSKTEHDSVSIDETYPPAMVELNFDSYGDRLNGILYQANGLGPHPTVVLLHGYPGNEKNLDLAQSMRSAGYNVLFFHYRGAWGSGGEYSYSNVIEDVGSAIDYLRTHANDIRVAPERLLLIGHSLGGFAALQGAARDEAVKCVAGIAAGDVGVIADFAQINPEFAKSFATSADALTMLNGWSGQKVMAELKNNRDAFSLVDLAPQLNGKSVLLIAGDKDKALVPEIFHTPLVEAYQKQSAIALTHKIIPGDHAFSWSRNELIDTVLSWAKTCEGVN